MNKYLKAEKRLAELLGYKVETISDVIWVIVPDSDPSSGGSRREWLPRGTRDNAAAFALMVEHTCYPVEFGGLIGINGSLTKVCVDLDDHPDKETAVRYAIVMAVIAKLEAA